MNPIIEQMHHFAPNVILDEEIFVTRNIGPNFDTIGNLLYDYGEKFILSALEDGIILSVKDLVFGHKECQNVSGAFFTLKATLIR